MAPSHPVSNALATTLLVVVAGAPVFLLAVVLGAVLRPASRDPHGYTAIFGVVLLVVLSPVTLLLVVVRRWARARR